MNSGVLLTATLLLLSAPHQSTLPAHAAPLRNTFVVAAETVVDDATLIGLNANDAQIQQLRTAKENLSSMAEDDREKEVVTAANDMIFAFTACHLQASNGASTDTCKAQFDRARMRVMVAIGKHKDGDMWIDGPPA